MRVILMREFNFPSNDMPSVGKKFKCENSSNGLVTQYFSLDLMQFRGLLLMIKIGAINCYFLNV